MAVSSTLLLAMFAMIRAALAQNEPSSVAERWTREALLHAVAPMRAGPALTPKVWPNGAKVAVCLTWDLDAESVDLVAGRSEPVQLSRGEFGATQGLVRILQLLDRNNIPGTFYVPATVAMLHPNMMVELKKRPQHEIGFHGWTHENLASLDGPDEEMLLKKALAVWTAILGKQPVGFRSPDLSMSRYTIGLLQQAGFEYDSSAMAMDQPYELVSGGNRTGVVELPVSWILNDSKYLTVPGNTMLPPEQASKVYRDEFDAAYEDGTLFLLTMHPMISGRRTNLQYLDELIKYMKTRPGVWFSTGQQVAHYVRSQKSSVVATQSHSKQLGER